MNTALVKAWTQQNRQNILPAWPVNAAMVGAQFHHEQRNKLRGKGQSV